MSDKLSSSAVLNLLASVTSEFVNVAIQNVMLKKKTTNTKTFRFGSDQQKDNSFILNLLPDYFIKVKQFQTRSLF